MPSGTLDSDGNDVTVAGDWSNAATYTADGNTVTLDGTNQTLVGDSTFYNLTKSVIAAEPLTFAAGSTTTINGTATLNGAASNLLSLPSDSPGTHWNLNLGSGAVMAIDYVNVSWSDASGSAVLLQPINPTNSDDGGNTIAWFGTINIVVTISSSVVQDPVNGMTNPKAIPGARMNYTLHLTNQGDVETDANTVVITKPIPSATKLFVGDLDGPGTGPVRFTDGTPASDLSYTYVGLNDLGDDLAFSNDGGSTFSYVPTPDGDNCDPSVTHLRISPDGTFDKSDGVNHPNLEFSLEILIK